MNVDEYLKNQSDLVSRVLLERPFARDWRVYSAGVLCLAGAVVMEFWAAGALIDPGFFARTSTFLTFVLGAGVWLLSIALSADVLIARIAIPSRNVVVEKTLGHVLKANSSLVDKLSARQD